MNRRLELAFLLCILHFTIYAQNPIFSFSNEYLFVQENSTVDICYSISDNISGSDPNYFINYEEKFDEKFIQFDSIPISTTAGEYCFTISIESISEEDTDFAENQLSFNIPDYSSNSTVQLGNTPSVSLLLSNVELGLDNGIFTSPLLIKGMDNHISMDGFNLSLITTSEIQPGETIGLTNANFSETNGWEAKNEELEFVELNYTAESVLPEFSTICIRSSELGSDTSPGIEFLVNGASSNYFEINANISQSFLDSTSWTNAYIYLGNMLEQNEIIIDGVLSDGITFGIAEENYPFDIPFDQSFMQLFFFDNPQSEHAYILCQEEMEICDLLTFFKTPENWIAELGDEADELEIQEVCVDDCNLIDCGLDSLTVSTHCDDTVADILFLIDESSSISNTEFEYIKDAVKISSEEIKCKIEDSRFAACGFAGSNSFQIINNFQFDPLNIDNHDQQGGNTNVTDAFSKLNDNIDNSGIEPRDSAQLYIILMTDASSENFYGFDPMNQIKDLPVGAQILVVYYTRGGNNDFVDASFAATCATKGGEYNGLLQDNPGDPEGEGPPRKFNAYDVIGPDISDAIEVLTTCDTLRFSYSGAQAILDWNMVVSNGGVVVQELSNVEYITNGAGSYSLNILTEVNCSYSASYHYDTNDDCSDKEYAKTEHEFTGTQRIALPESQNTSTQLKPNISHTSVVVYPIPTEDILHIRIPPQLGIRSIDVLNMQGALIQSIPMKDQLDLMTLHTEEYAEGVYLLRFRDNYGQYTYVKFLIART